MLALAGALVALLLAAGVDAGVLPAAVGAAAAVTSAFSLSLIPSQRSVFCTCVSSS